MKVNPHKSSLGMDANILALLLYGVTALLSLIPGLMFIAWVLPLVFFFIEKKSPFVKFHAIQATCLYVVFAVLALIFNIVKWASLANLGALMYGTYGAGYILANWLIWIVWIAVGVLAVIAAIKSYGYFEYKIPVVGNLADKWSKKGMKM